MSPIRPENRRRYPDDWSEISRRIRFERAAGRCECLGECGRGTHEGRCPNRHGEPAYGTGSAVVLTTAHLDHTPEHCDDDNLRAMCQGCHLHYDREHHAETRRATREAELGLVPLFVCNPPEFPELSADLDDMSEDAERQLLLANLDMVLAEWLSSDEWASAATRRALDFPIDPWRPLTTLTPSEVYL